MGELRPGDTHTKTGTQALLAACFAKRPPTTRAVVSRADKGFYDHKLIEWLEGQGARFVVVARLTRPLKRKLAALPYTEARPGIDTAELAYQPHGWQKPYRFVVIRRPKPEDPTDQLSLVPIGRYVYQVFVTNLDLLPLNLWRFYNGRAAVEHPSHPAAPHSGRAGSGRKSSAAKVTGSFSPSKDMGLRHQEP